MPSESNQVLKEPPVDNEIDNRQTQIPQRADCRPVVEPFPLDSVFHLADSEDAAIAPRVHADSRISRLHLLDHGALEHSS